MPAIGDILTAYRQLREHCDTFARQTAARYGNDIHCCKGCGDCCRLTSVLGIEAIILTEFLDSLPLSLPLQPAQKEFCPFLDDNICLVYPVRPIICRTHGLPLASTTFTAGVRDCCPLNFTTTPLGSLEPGAILDLDQINANLIRLNLAVFLLLGAQDLAGRRFLLRDISSNRLPEILTRW